MSTAGGSASMATMTNDGTSAFTLGVDVSHTSVADTLATGDLDGDAKLDVVTGNSFGAGVDVLIGNGDDTFNVGARYLAQGGDSNTVYLFDIDNDGWVDVIDLYHSTITVIVNQCGK